MKKLREIVSALSQNRDIRKIRMERDSLFNAVSESSGHKPLLNFCTLLALLIGSLLFIVNISIYLIHDVLLFDNNIVINHSGAFMPSKPNNGKQAIYIFNTSEPWAYTGVEVKKGDRIKVSVSGAFHCSLSKIRNAAVRNNIPQYPWIGSNLRKMMRENPDKLRESEFFRDLFSNSDTFILPDAPFGEILFQICSDAETRRSDFREFAPRLSLHGKEGRFIRDSLGIYELKHLQDNYYEVQKNGALYVAVNDIYLNDYVILKSEEQNEALLKSRNLGGKHSYPAAELDPIRDSLRLYYESDGEIFVSGPEFRDYFRNHRHAWYNDNIGQIAITVDIQQFIPNRFINQRSWYRGIETMVNNALDHHRWWNVLLLLLLFLICIPAIFLAVYALFTVVIYLLLWGMLKFCELLVAVPNRIWRKYGSSLRRRRRYK